MAEQEDKIEALDFVTTRVDRYSNDLPPVFIYRGMQGTVECLLPGNKARVLFLVDGKMIKVDYALSELEEQKARF